MNVSLTPELEAFVHEKVKSGRYGSASEVVREALRLLEREDEARQAQLDEIRQKVQVGLDQLEQGQYTSVPADELGAYLQGLLDDAKRKKREEASD